MGHNSVRARRLGGFLCRLTYRYHFGKGEKKSTWIQLIDFYLQKNPS